MCGKTNPADLDVCQFCQARLRPIWETGPLQDAEGEDQGANPDPEEWLRALGGDIGTTPEDQVSSQQDWLGRLRSETPAADPDEIAARPLEDLPGENADWLSRLGLQGDSAPPTAGNAVEPTVEGVGYGKDESSWSDFSMDTGLPEPDWLKAEPQTDDRRAERDDELPDWLLNARAEDAALEAEISPTPAEELPNWLLSSSTADTGEETGLPEAAEEDLPDWLKGVESEALPTEGADQAVSPGFLPEEPDNQALFTTEPAPIAGEAFEAEEQEQGLQSDWSDLMPEGDTPDWLRTAMQEEAPGEDQAEEPAAEEAAYPAWLAGVDAQTSTSLADNPPENDASGAGADEEEDFGAWIASVGAAALVHEHNEPDTSADSLDWMENAGTAPEWLQEFSGDKAPANPAEGERPGWLPSGGDAGADIFSQEPDTTDWIASVGEQANQLQAAPEDMLPGEDDNDLSWLDTLEASYPGVVLEQDAGSVGFGSPGDNISAEAGSIVPGDLPAWLSGEAGTNQAPEQPSEHEELNPGDLPVWLLGMRPEGALRSEEMPSAAPSVFEQVEGAGPLAGLRGALPAEPDISQAEKPPTYSVMLQVTEVQNSQAKMLADLVGAEAETAVIVGRQATGSQPVFRWAVTALLILALLTSIVTGLPVMYRPVMPVEIVAVRDIIEGLESGAPVLVAVDYEPGYSAEMDAATRAAVTHMLRRGAVPTFISTTPTGPMQVERLMGQIGLSEKRAFTSGEQYVNLGYLSGGAIALASFAAMPSAGASQPPQSAGSLAGYRVVTVAAADPDRARSWIEQTGPTLGSTPLVLILSEQAEPMVRPYFDAYPRQVEGMLTGLTGALIYETNTGQQGGASRDWAPFNVGLAVAITLMLTGGAYNILSGRLTRRKAASEVKSV